MAKKITTVIPAPVAPVETAIPETYVVDIEVAHVLALVQVASMACTADIEVGKRSETSGKSVAHAFDGLFAFDWTRYKGNGSLKTCEANLGMTPDQFKAVRTIRDTYKTGWENAGLSAASFDRRWQFVKENSEHHVVESNNEGGNEGDGEGDGEGEGEGEGNDSVKTTLEQCIAALQNALRYATAEDFGGDLKTSVRIREALKLNGITDDD